MARRERRGAKGPRPSTTAQGVPSKVEGRKRAAAFAKATASHAEAKRRRAGAGRGAPATKNDARAKAVEGILRDAARVHERAAGESAGAVVAVADALQAAFGSGAKVLIFGNGGSAADAQHFACELVGRFLRERRAMPAIALTADTTAVTAIANDYGFDRVFVRQIEAHGRPGDVAVGISTSGTSANVLAGLEYAKSRGLKTVAFTGGSGGPIGATADVHVNVPHDLTPRVQEVHRTLIHAVCELVEQRMGSNG